MNERTDIDACAALVERGDPDRFLATMAAPAAARPALLTLYAFNLEVARVGWVTKEPPIAQMRLQFWRDVVDEAGDAAPRAHEVAAPLAALIKTRALPKGLFHSMIDAREADIDRAPFADESALWAYLEATGGALMMLAVRALGPAEDGSAQDYGTAQALANYLLAIPALEGAGRMPLPDGRPRAVAALAQAGLDRMVRAGTVSRASRPALLAAWQTRAILMRAARDPGAVGAGQLGQSEFRRRGSLLWRTFVGV